MNINEFIKTDKVSRLTGISKHTLRRKAMSGQIPAFKIRGEWLFHPDDVDELFRPNSLAKKRGVHDKKRLDRGDL